MQDVQRQPNQVIPPPNFKFKAMKLDEMLKKVIIPHPLEQQVFVGRDFYDLRLIQRKALQMSEYKRLVDKDAQQIKGKGLLEVEQMVG